jgi:SAM-dependent methyltransferase
MRARRKGAGFAAVAARTGDALPQPDTSIHPVGGRTGDARGPNQLAFLQHYGLVPTAHVLEIGCGVGRLAYELASVLTDGSYVGVDISPKAIGWLNEHYAPRLRAFRFDLLDIRNPRYRPRGSHAASEMRFPYPSEHFDVVAAFAVFMHISIEEIANYLTEIRRLLAPDGFAAVTLRAVLPGQQPPPARGRDWVPVAAGVYSIFPELEHRSMAYDVSLARETIAAAGLSVVAEIEGSWHLRPQDPTAGPRLGADAFVLRRTPTASPT